MPFDFILCLPLGELGGLDRLVLFLKKDCDTTDSPCCQKNETSFRFRQKRKRMRITKLFLALVAVVASMTVANAQQVGDATYYSNRLHGRYTSDGSRYHRDSLTCAHKTYPLGTYLKVRNPRNGQEVVVKVTDRGPYRKGAIVDLSYAAAKEIGMIAAGVARVEVERIESPTDYLAAPEEETLQLPELRVRDAATGEYYTVSEWSRRNEEEKARAREAEAARQRARYTAKAQKEKRWRVLSDKMTAQNTLKATTSDGLFRRGATPKE